MTTTPIAWQTNLSFLETPLFHFDNHDNYSPQSPAHQLHLQKTSFKHNSHIKSSSRFSFSTTKPVSKFLRKQKQADAYLKIICSSVNSKCWFIRNVQATHILFMDERAPDFIRYTCLCTCIYHYPSEKP